MVWHASILWNIHLWYIELNNEKSNSHFCRTRNFFCARITQTTVTFSASRNVQPTNCVTGEKHQKTRGFTKDSWLLREIKCFFERQRGNNCVNTVNGTHWAHELLVDQGIYVLFEKHFANLLRGNKLHFPGLACLLFELYRSDVTIYSFEVFSLLSMCKTAFKSMKTWKKRKVC